MNPMSKRLIVVLLIVLLFLTGCGKTENDKPPESMEPEEVSETVSSGENEADPGEEESAPEENQAEEDPAPNNEEEENTSEEETIFEVKDSKYLDGWKELTLKDYSFTTDDWESYSFKENSPMIGYKLHFPGSWEVEFSVFYDDEGKKVAELFPPIMMKQGQTLLDTWEVSGDCELISRDNIQVGDLKGERIIVKAYPHSGEITEWYPYTYYLTDGQKVFAISFYSGRLDEEKQKEFEGILESFEFID